MKRTNGITLIALIITIIVILILAGVALATLTGEGSIIENAEKAVGQYNNKVIEEQETLNSIGKYFENGYNVDSGEETIETGTFDKTEIANNPNKHYGGYVTNYTTPSGDPNVKWRIFYADNSNIYLIADNYIHFDYVPQSNNYTLATGDNEYVLAFENVYKDYTGASNITDSRITKWLNYIKDNSTASTTSMKCIAFMLDTTAWGKYANETYAEYAIGAPTLDLFCASYNDTHQERQIQFSYDSTGYVVQWIPEGSEGIGLTDIDSMDGLYVTRIIGNRDKAYGTWIASPSYSNDVFAVMCGGIIQTSAYTSYYTQNGLRPIVCLKSSVKLEKQSDGTYVIK